MFLYDPVCVDARLYFRGIITGANPASLHLDSVASLAFEKSGFEIAVRMPTTGRRSSQMAGTVEGASD